MAAREKHRYVDGVWCARVNGFTCSEADDQESACAPSSLLCTVSLTYCLWYPFVCHFHAPVAGNPASGILDEPSALLQELALPSVFPVCRLHPSGAIAFPGVRAA